MSTQLHSSAVIDSAAELGVDVQVGPYAIIEAGCVIGD
jgi:acyl-[acyl carrier protein]--UDP-N-acetylglucosamine O-acyltransferase